MFSALPEAAKEEMSLCGPLCADPAAAWETSCVAENSRHGFQLLDSTLRLASGEVKSTTALGIAWTLYDGGIRSRCTGKERDQETGLDNFGKRYYGSALGRFITPDPFMNSGRPDNPQTWNRYTYVLNNPLRYIDPTGLYTWGSCSGSSDQCKGYQQRFRDSLANLKKSASQLDPHSKEGKKLNGIIKRYGEEGKGGPSINFGDAGHDKNGNAYLGSTLGNKVTLNYEAVDNEVKSWGNALHYNSDQQKTFSDAVNAALTGHEGGHLAAFGLPGLSFMMHTEKTALFSESATYQGLHFTDPMSDALWNESWANASDREQLRSKAIQNELDRQAGKDQPNK